MIVIPIKHAGEGESFNNPQSSQARPKFDLKAHSSKRSNFLPKLLTKTLNVHKQPLYTMRYLSKENNRIKFYMNSTLLFINRKIIVVGSIIRLVLVQIITVF